MMSHRTSNRRDFIKKAAALTTACFALLRTAPVFAQTGADIPAGLAGFRGSLISRSSPVYLDWFNAMTWYRAKAPRYPAMFAQPVDADDLKLLVAYANTAGLHIATRSSGHNISMPPLRKDALTIDMSLFGQIEVDVDSKSAWVGPGVTSEELNRFLYAKGFSFPSAHTGFVTIGGFLLGGGMGWNMQNWGMACGSILALELVLADGRLVTASETENPDLFWAARGAGSGFFAIVTRYKLRIYDTPKVVKNTFFVPLDGMEAAVNELQRLLPESANRSEMLCSLGRFSPPGTPEDENRWHLVATIMSFGASEQDAIAAAVVINNSPVLRNASFQQAHNQPLTYLELYEQLGTDNYSEYRTTEVALFTDQPAQALRMVAKHLEHNTVDPRSFGFAVIGCNPTVPEPCSYTYTQPHYVSWYLIATTDAGVLANEKLARELMADLKPLVKSYYMNEIDLALFPDFAKGCFSPEKWAKLGELRKKYDPDGRFFSYVE